MINTFNKPKRCQSITQSGTVCRVRKCTIYKINGKYHCRIHFNYNFVKFIIIIQKYWRSYYCRKKVNNIYKHLPYDLQQKIIWHMREDKYYINLTQSINKIIKKRTNELHKISGLQDRYIIRTLRYYNTYTNVPSIYLDDVFLENVYLNIINNNSFVLSTCKLYNKYKYWDYTTHNTLQNVLDNVLALIELIIDYNIYLNVNNINNINNNSDNIIILNNLKNILFKSIWTSES